ncbi:MAG TPA: Fe-S cluster assembly protein SufD [Fimbriimonadaceae bacterium]|nr:Fe-S cluster assembly protein SufD [Fimbriimonadaceae bacterium]
MAIVYERGSRLTAEYESIKGLLDGLGPSSLATTREAARARFDAVGLPNAKDEEFKYISFKDLAEGRFGLPYGAILDRHQVAEHPIGKLDAITVAFINGQYAPELCSDHILPDGAFVGSLEDGFLSHGDAILANLGKLATLEGRLGSTNDERFVDLNTAFLGEGAFVYVPRGEALERPIHILWLGEANHGPFAVHPRSLVVLEAGATAKVIESFIGRKGAYFTNSVAELKLGAGANLEHVKFQDETSESTHVANIAYDQEADSVLTSVNVNLGGKLVRNDVNVWLNGEHTETWLNGVNLAQGEQTIDNHTRIDHAKPNCNSFEVYKSILGGHASGVFNGKIFVYEDAQKTDAKQTNQAVLLSPTATFNTKPQLEIFADDVKCTHGATVGRLQDDALFYLRSRGIPSKDAQALLVYAFAAEVLEKLSVAEVRSALEGMLFERLAAAEE